MKHLKAFVIAAFALGGSYLADKIHDILTKEDPVDHGFQYEIESLDQLDIDISQLASNYQIESIQLLRSLISFPAQHLDLSAIDFCEQYNNFLKQIIIEQGAVLSNEDIFTDSLGNLVWCIYDPFDHIPMNQRHVIFVHSTYSSLFNSISDWSQQFGPGISPYEGITQPDQVNESALRQSLSYLSSKAWWGNDPMAVTFGVGSSSGIQGILSQIMAFKILCETVDRRSLQGCVVVGSIAHHHHQSYHTYHDETLIPDVVILSEATGTADTGPCTIAIGQRGKAVIDVSICGKEVNPEIGANIIAEATEAGLDGFGHDDIIGDGERNTTEAIMSNDTFSIRFVRTLTTGESPFLALREIKSLPTIKSERDINVEISDSFRTWKTPLASPAIRIASLAYRRVISPYIDGGIEPEELRKEPRYTGRHNPDDFIGYPITSGPTKPSWYAYDGRMIPPIFAIGAGFAENKDKPGEFIINDHLRVPIAMIARFPSLYRDHK